MGAYAPPQPPLVTPLLVVYQAILLTYVHKLPNINQEYIYMPRLLPSSVGLPDDQNKDGCMLTCLLMCISREQKTV
jgi:hypothetical protein